MGENESQGGNGSCQAGSGAGRPAGRCRGRGRLPTAHERAGGACERRQEGGRSRGKCGRWHGSRGLHICRSEGSCRPAAGGSAMVATAACPGQIKLWHAACTSRGGCCKASVGPSCHEGPHSARRVLLRGAPQVWHVQGGSGLSLSRPQRSSIGTSSSSLASSLACRGDGGEGEGHGEGWQESGLDLSTCSKAVPARCRRHGDTK